MLHIVEFKFLYCAPHTFYFGHDIPQMIRDAGPLVAHVHVADTYNHKASSGLRYICNPPGAKVTIIPADDYFQSMAQVVVASDKAIAEEPDKIRRLVRATLKGVQAVIDG